MSRVTACYSGSPTFGPLWTQDGRCAPLRAFTRSGSTLGDARGRGWAQRGASNLKTAAQKCAYRFESCALRLQHNDLAALAPNATTQPRPVPGPGLDPTEGGA